MARDNGTPVRERDGRRNGDVSRIPPKGESPEVRAPADDAGWATPTVTELVGWMVERPGPRRALESAMAQGAPDAQRFLAVLDVALDLAQLEARGEGLHPKMLDLQAIVERAHRSLGEAVPARLALRIDEDVPVQVHADADQLERVLAALISIAAPTDGSDAVEIRIGRTEDDPDRTDAASVLTVAIQPGGDGPAPDPVEVPHPGSVPRAARGLGLAVCAELVSQMGGELAGATDPEDVGTFWLTFPRTSAAPGGQDDTR